jgi:hypothetical protein
MIDHLHDAVDFLNTNTMFAGFMMLLLNVGSRYIVHEFSEDDKEYRQNILIRRICIFAVCFVGTKDVLTSLILTAGFIIISGGLFRGKGEASREGMTTLSEGGAVSSFGAMQDPSPPLFDGSN